MSDNHDGLDECDACGDQAACDAENWCIEHDAPLVPRDGPRRTPKAPQPEAPARNCGCGL